MLENKKNKDIGFKFDHTRKQTTRITIVCPKCLRLTAEILSSHLAKGERNAVQKRLIKRAVFISEPFS
jgi:hypothetical protein